jgi:hypothetical protein
MSGWPKPSFTIVHEPIGRHNEEALVNFEPKPIANPSFVIWTQVTVNTFQQGLYITTTVLKDKTKRSDY